MRRRLAALLPLCLLLALLPACQSLSTRSTEPAPDRLGRILERGELRVGLSGDQPPLNMRTAAGELIGLEVDLMSALAQSMGLEVRFVEMPFAELLPAVEKGEVDLVASGVTITPERNARTAFVGPYMVSGKSLLTRSDALASASSKADLDDPGRTYAALAGSTSEALVRDALPRAKLVSTRDYDEAVEMVIDGRADALVADFPICFVSILRHPDAGLQALTTPFTVEPLGIALPADAPLLVNLVENYLNTLESTGLLTRLKARWFSEGDWIAELP